MSELPFPIASFVINRQKHWRLRTSLSQHLSLKDCCLEIDSPSIGHLGSSSLKELTITVKPLFHSALIPGISKFDRIRWIFQSEAEKVSNIVISFTLVNLHFQPPNRNINKADFNFSEAISFRLESRSV